jgi:hypothetical protein
VFGVGNDAQMGMKASQQSVAEVLLQTDRFFYVLFR